jgi:hypothetical protein
VVLIASVNAGLLAATARPATSALLTLCCCAVLASLNWAKETALREPLVLSDAFLLPQVFSSPEMYLPFLPVRELALGAVLGIAAVAGLLLAEAPLPELRRPGAAALLCCLAVAPWAGIAAMRCGCLQGPARWLLRLCPVGSDAVADADRNGALTAGLLRPVWAGVVGADGMFADRSVRPLASRLPEDLEGVLAGIDPGRPEECPHIVLVQAESFCDVREIFRLRLTAAQQDALQGILPNWDRLRARGGALPTPEEAFGAYTMRTEFGMLTGLSGEALGPWRHNPYILASRRPVWSVAWHLRQLGYATVCIHPYGKTFFRRDRVMPNLGFQRFIGTEGLDGVVPAERRRFGPYVSDEAVGSMILDVLASADRPVFCFAITMETHGPWRPGRLSEAEVAQALAGVDRELFGVRMQLYLTGVRHADELFGRLMDAADTMGRGMRLLAYGDHKPGLSNPSPA